MKKYLAFVMSCLIVMSAVSGAFALSEKDIKLEETLKIKESVVSSTEGFTSVKENTKLSMLNATSRQVTASAYNYMTVTVPSGWTSYEENNGYVLYVVNQSDSSQFMRFELGKKNGRSFSDIAQDVYNDYSGSNMLTGSSGYYYFGATIDGERGVAWVYDADHRFSSVSIPDGWYLVDFETFEADSSTTWSIFSSLKFDVTNAITQTNGTTHQFTYMTLDVPYNWDYSESENSETHIVRLNDRSNSNAFILLQVFPIGNYSLPEIAETYFDELKGDSLYTFENGAYWFETNIGSDLGAGTTVYLDSHQTANIVPEGYVCVQAISAYVPDSIIEDVASSITFTVGNSTNQTTGTTQTVGEMTMTVPSGWTPTLSQYGVVSISDSDGDKIILSLMSLGNLTLQSAAYNLYNTLEGTKTVLSQDSSGYFSFTITNSYGVKFLTFVDDSTTYTRIPSGYYCVQMLTNNSTTADAYKMVWESINFTPSDSSNNGNNYGESGGNYSTDSNATFNVISNNSSSTKIDNLGSDTSNQSGSIVINKTGGSNSQTVVVEGDTYNNTVNTQKNPTVNVSGGGCNAGFGLLAILVLGAGVRRRRS